MKWQDAWDRAREKYRLSKPHEILRCALCRKGEAYHKNERHKFVTGKKEA